MPLGIHNNPGASFGQIQLLGASRQSQSALQKLSSGLRINQRYGGHGDTTDATVANAEGGFEMETEDFKRSDFDRAEDEEGDAELGNKKEEEDDDEKKKKEEEEEEAPVEEAAQPYVYNDEDDDFPYVDEYTHLDDEHYFAQEADHDAETGII